MCPPLPNKTVETKQDMDQLIDIAYLAGHRNSTYELLTLLMDFTKSSGKLIPYELLNEIYLEHFKQCFEKDYGSYQEYIKSPQWQAKADRLKAASGWKCQLCNKDGNKTTLHAHHKTYDRLGFEDDNDIIILCKDCHAKFHDKD